MKTFSVVIALVVGLAVGAWLIKNSRPATPIPVGEPTRIAMGEPKPAGESAPGPVELAPADPRPTASKPGPAPVVAPPAPQRSDPLIPPVPVEAKPAETKPAETQPAETKPVEAEPAEPGPAETAPAESRPVEIKPAETKPSEATPVAPKAVEPAPAPEPEPVPAPRPAPGEADREPIAPPAAEPAPVALQSPDPLAPPEPAAVKDEAPAAKPQDAAPPSDGPPVIEKRADGSMLVDGQYEVTGEGTREKPYEVTWEMLISAQETYQPKEGKKLIPGRLAMLDNKHVRVTGYIAFPLYVQEAREMLSMLNQWDGCCIGVPPTPYDAIEVRLRDAVTGPERFATFGSVEGRFGVKPYVVGDWLVGLYTMDDAKFTAQGFGGN